MKKVIDRLKYDAGYLSMVAVVFFLFLVAIFAFWAGIIVLFFVAGFLWLVFLLVYLRFAFEHSAFFRYLILAVLLITTVFFVVKLLG